MSDEENIIKLKILLYYFEKQQYDPKKALEIRNKIKKISKRLIDSRVIH